MSIRMAVGAVFGVLVAAPLLAQQPVYPVASVLALDVVPAPAHETSADKSDSTAAARTPWSSWSMATGGWNGLRSRLEAKGLSFSADLIQDFSANLSGGSRRGGVERSLFNAGLSADLDSILGLKGGSAFAGFHAHRGGNGSDLTGDIQAFSNIDAPHFARMGEVWYQQLLAGDRVRVKLGGVDANSEFAVVEPAGFFLNASGGFSPTILGMPTYPTAPLSANLFVTPVSWLTAGVGVYRGVFGDRPTSSDKCRSPFLIGELASDWSLGKNGNGRVLAGYWRNTGYAPDVAGDWRFKPSGWYAAVTQRISGAAASEETQTHGLTLFGKFGRGPEGVGDFNQHLMAGAVVEAPFSLSGHAVGAMVSQVDLAGTLRHETAVEAFYQLPVAGFLTLRPDLQYVVSPSGQMANAFAGTLRLEVTF